MKTNIGFWVLLSSILTCGLITPVWLIIGLVWLIVKIISPTPEPPKPKIILPSNDFADEWEFRMYELDLE